jgi:hypothetical protein
MTHPNKEWFNLVKYNELIIVHQSKALPDKILELQWRTSCGRLIHFCACEFQYTIGCWPSQRSFGGGHPNFFLLPWRFPILESARSRKSRLGGTLSARRRSKFCPWIWRATRASQWQCCWPKFRNNSSQIDDSEIWLVCLSTFVSWS